MSDAIKILPADVIDQAGNVVEPQPGDTVIVLEDGSDWLREGRERERAEKQRLFEERRQARRAEFYRKLRELREARR